MKPSYRERLHGLAAIMFAATVVSGTSLLGGGGVWVRLGMEIAIAGALACWAVGGCRRPGLAVGALALAALPLLQTVDVPEWLLRRIAPMSAAAWKVVASEGGDARSCISVEPGTTLLACRRSLLIALSLVALIDVVRLPFGRRLLVRSLAITGMLVLFLGIACGSAGDDRKLMRVVPLRGPIWDHVNPVYPPVQSSGFGQLEWVDVGDQRYRLDSPTVGAGFGPFLYANHFPCALVLMLPFAAEAMVPLLMRFVPVWAACCLAAAPWVVGLLLTAVGIGARAATVVMLFTMAAWIWLRTGNSRLKLPAGIAAATGAVGLVVLASLLASGINFSPLAARLPSALQPAARALFQDTRSTTAAVASRTFRAAPFFGTGADSYRVMYTKMKPANEAVYYAHNEPFQLLAENGVLGGLFVLAMTAIMGVQIRRLKFPGTQPLDPMHAAAWTATLGVAAASLFEWVWHLPSLCLASCIAAGLALGWPWRKPAPDGRGNPLLSRITGGLIATLCLVTVCVLTRDAIAESARQELQRAVVLDIRQLRRLTTEGPGTALARAIDAAGATAAWDPGNARLAALLSQAHLHAARLAGSEIERADLLATSARWAARARQASPLLVGLPEARPGSVAAEAAARTP